MQPWVAAAAVIAASYLAGSVPFAYLVTKAVRGIDIRTVGSGNVGATNASRVLGRRWFAVVFALDFAKGALPVLLLAALPEFAGAALLRFRMACGLATLAGHVFPVFLGFRGGKGVATGAGVLTALAPVATAISFGGFLVALAASRYVSLASVIACALLAPAAWLLASPGELVVFCALIGGLVILLHRKNLSRIAAGTEPKICQRKEPAGA